MCNSKKKIKKKLNVELNQPLLSLSTDMSNEFANEYYAQLLDLTFNSKPLITALSQIAGEHVLDGSVVVELILRRIQLVKK